MEITEKERLLLVKKKEEIYTQTCEILDIIHNAPPLITESKKITELKKRITGILSNISIVASYADSKSHKLEPLTTIANTLFSMMSSHERFISKTRDKEEEDFVRLLNDYAWQLIVKYTDLFCNIVNSIQFKLTKKGLKITVPISIRF